MRLQCAEGDCYNDRRMCDAVNKLYVDGLHDVVCSTGIRRQSIINWRQLPMTASGHWLVDGRSSRRTMPTSMALLISLNKLAKKISVTAHAAYVKVRPIFNRIRPTLVRPLYVCVSKKRLNRNWQQLFSINTCVCSYNKKSAHLTIAKRCAPTN